MSKSKIIKLFFSLALPLVVGIIAGIYTYEGTSVWLDTLNSPSFRPPNWLFGPVWTVLYLWVIRYILFGNKQQVNCAT